MMAASSRAALVRSRMHGCDLRFADRSAEAAFKRDLEPVLATYTGIMGFGLFVFTGAFFVVLMGGDEPIQWDNVGPRMFRIYGMLAEGTMFGLFSLLCLLRVRCGFLRVLDWEAVVICMMVAVAQQPILCRPSVYSMICRPVFGTCAAVDMADGYHLGMEMNGPLIVDMVITAAHLSLPIRSCRVWVVDVAVLLEYFVVTLYAARSGHYILAPGDCLQLFGLMAILAGFAFAGGRRNEKHVRSDWKARGTVVKQQHQLDQQHSAMARILSRLCDSLVHLGADLTIVEPCPSLGALLFGRQTLGKNFCDFMALESEQPVLIDELRKTSAASSAAEPDVGMLHVSLLDSFKKTVRVHVHHACFWASNGEVQYLLGLVESGERQSPPSETARTQPQPVALPELSAKLEVVLARGDGDVFTVVSICAELRSLLGDGLEGGPLDALLHSKDLEKFLQWLRERLDAARAGAWSESAAYGTVTLLTRGDYSALMYQAKVSGNFRADGGRVLLRVKPPKHVDSGSRRSDRGTPADTRRQGLEGAPSSAASGPPSVSSGGSTLPAPGRSVSKRFRTTKELGRRRSALTLVGSWNVQMPRKICCAYHANVAEIMGTFTSLRGYRCEDMHSMMRLAREFWQCQHCGILGDGPNEDGVCNLCETKDTSMDNL